MSSSRTAPTAVRLPRRDIPRWDREGVVHGPRRAARVDGDTLPVWGQGLGPAAELPLGAELYLRAGSAGDLVAGNPANRVFDRVTMALRAAKGDEDAERHSRRINNLNRVFNGVPGPQRAAKARPRSSSPTTRLRQSVCHCYFVTNPKADRRARASKICQQRRQRIFPTWKSAGRL